jgi:hypothetical protein
MQKPRKARSMWVEGVALARRAWSHRGKVLRVSSSLSIGLEEGASVALSMATQLGYVVSHSHASVVFALDIMIGSIVLAL